MIYEGIAEYLGNELVGLTYSLQAGGNIFLDNLPAEPDQAVCLYSHSAGEADSLLPYDPVVFQVVVRSEADGNWARTTAARVYDFLHGKRHIVLPNNDYLVYALAMDAGPSWLGTDDNGRAQFGIDFRAEALNPTEERPA